MMNSITTIKSIGLPHSKKLEAAGIKTTDALLEQCGSGTGRKIVATKTGISEDLLLRWVNNADLMRLNGVEADSSQLLEAAGVGTLTELKDRVPEKLQAKLAEVNATKKLLRQTPGLPDVQAWIAAAKTTQPLVSA